MALSLTPHDRVLILGASGWFGRTFLDMVPRHILTMAIASHARDRYVAWDLDAVQAFAPTIVANFAFLTRERVLIDGEDRFRQVNDQLTGQFMAAADLPCVRAALTISSGAAITEPSTPYGALKLIEEKRASALVHPGRAAVVGRAYSVSGAHIRRPRDYAFSDLILQAATGSITVRAPRPVYRRYVSVEDFLHVCLERALRGWSGTIDSGGELVEMGDLAARVARVVNPAALVSRAPAESNEASSYASDNTSWQHACRELNYREATLEEQIWSTAAGLRGEAQ